MFHLHMYAGLAVLSSHYLYEKEDIHTPYDCCLSWKVGVLLFIQCIKRDKCFSVQIGVLMHICHHVLLVLSLSFHMKNEPQYEECEGNL